MKIEDLMGYYTYRSLLDRSAPVDDFNTIKFAEAELFIYIADDGTISGTLSFPAAPAASEKGFMDLSGTVTSWSPLRLHFIGRGRANTNIVDFEYEYDCGVTHTWDSATPPQSVVLTGTVRRNEDHGAAKAGLTASFVAVKRTFVEPRDVPGVSLIPEAVAMLSSRSHRLRHTVWHTIRGDWYRRDQKMTDEDREYIRSLGWGIDDPPFTPTFQLDLTNGAGEDFLFMHRRMIKMLQDVYKENGKVAPTGWKTIPGPVTAQYAYKATPDPANPVNVVFQYDTSQSGFFVPPATDEIIEAFGEGNRFLKNTRFFSVIMRNIENWLRNPRILAQLTLGAYGNLLEMTIHNWMHMRWSTAPRDPGTGKPGGREPYDVNERWDAPHNDVLSDFHSSHVNPIFWRLHGWVDDRIEEWFQAQESVRPGVVKRRMLKDIPWFEKGDWVLKSDPFDWPEGNLGGHGHGHGGHGDAAEIEAMLKVMDHLREVDSRPVLSPAVVAPGPLTLSPSGRPLTGFAKTVAELDFSQWLVSE